MLHSMGGAPWRAGGCHHLALCSSRGRLPRLKPSSPFCLAKVLFGSCPYPRPSPSSFSSSFQVEESGYKLQGFLPLSAREMLADLSQK